MYQRSKTLEKTAKRENEDWRARQNLKVQVQIQAIGKGILRTLPNKRGHIIEERPEALSGGGGTPVPG